MADGEQKEKYLKEIRWREIHEVAETNQIEWHHLMSVWVLSLIPALYF